MNYFLRFSLIINFILIASVSSVAFESNFKPEFSNSENETSIIGKIPADPITGTIIGSNSVCLNANKPVITFTGKGGTAPYTFVYQINKVIDISITTAAGKDTITVKAPTNAIGTFAYTLISVKDASSNPQLLSENAIITVNPLPVVDFSFTNNNTCSGTPIQFTPSIIGAYSYEWDFGDLSNSAINSPTHEFKAIGTGTQIFNVKLTVTDSLTSCRNSITKPVTVKQAPDAALNILGNDGATQYDTINRVFINCSATKTSPHLIFVAVNASTTNTTNTGYTINWGDGGPREDFPGTFTKTTHSYNNLGFFDINILSKNINAECSNSTTYRFFNGNSPAGNLGSLGNVDDCAPYTLKWPVQNTSTNPPGTTYEFSVNDGSAPQKFDQSTLPDSIIHTFTKSSCGLGLANNSFTVSFTAKNPCKETPTTLQVLATEKPKANFNISPNLCLNNTVTFTDSSTGRYAVGNTCYSVFVKTWSISPNTGWTGNLTNATSINIKFNAIGDYIVKLKINRPNYSDSKCNADSITKIIHINPLPTATISGGTSVCKDATPPEITFTGSNGIAPYTFTYKINNASNKTVKTTSDNNSVKIQAPTGTAGTFTYTLVSVQEGSSSACSQLQTGTAVILVKPIPTATISGTKNVCLNESSPLVTFTGSNGTAPYTFTYNINGEANQTIKTTIGSSITISAPTNIVGVYKYNLVSGSDAGTNDCTQTPTGSVTITVNQPPVQMTLVNQEFCNGVVTPIITFSNTVAGTTYKWTNSNTSIGLADSGSGNIPAFTAKNNTAVSITSIITITPNVNGCNGTSQTFTITVNPSPSLIFSPSNQTICSGESTAPVTLSSATIGVEISWTTVQPSGISEAISLSGTYTIPAQIMTNNTDAPVTVIYKAKAILSGTTSCQGIEYTYTITVIPKPVLMNNLTTTTCSGIPFSFSPINGEGFIIPTGTKYTWSAPTINPAGTLTGGSALTIPQSVISQTLVNTTSVIATAAYSVIPITNGCAGNPFVIIVTVNPSTVINPINNLTLCNKDQNAEIVFSGIPAGAIYKWSSTNVNIGMAGSSGSDKIPAFTAINTGTSPIISTITVMPANNSGNPNCDGTSVKFSITVNPTGQVNNPGNIIACNKQNVTINFTTKNTGGTTTYVWTNSNTILGLGASGNGNISFTPINTGNTSMTTTITVIPIFTNNGVSCKGTSEQFTISVNPIIINLTSQTDIKCFGESTGAVTIDVHGGNLIEVTPGIFDFKYAWTGPGGFKSFNKNLNNVLAGNYNLTVTDNSGCSQALPFVTKESTQIVVTANTTAINCYGDNNASIRLTISGGVSPYQALWDNFATGTFQDNLSAGDYTITVTDANNCRKTIKVNLPEASLFKVTPEVKNVSCFGAHDGSIKLNYEGETENISLSWSDNSTSGTSRNNIGPGTYTVNITGGNHCPITRAFVIVEPLPLILTAKVTDAYDCLKENSGAIDLLATGGTSPYHSSWSNGAKTEDLSNISAGNYVVTVTDSIGCIQTAQYIVKRPLPIEINVTTKIDYNCASKRIKEICVAKVTGGVPPYLLNWSVGTTSGVNKEIMETDYSGSVVLNVTDALGCKANNTFNVKIPIIGMDYQLFDCDQHAFQFNAFVVNELEKYTYNWDFSDGTSSNIKNPQHAYQAAGIYKVRLTITDSSNSCVSEYEQTVNVEFPPPVYIDKEPKFCRGDSILIHATGADTYKWNDGTSGNSILIKNIGNYSVTGFSKAGCTAKVNFTASYFEMMNYTIQSDKNELTTFQDQLHLWSENIPFSNYGWDFGDGMIGQGFDLFHTYDITEDGYFDVKLKVINPNGCKEEATKRIWINIISPPNTFTPNGDGINDIYLKGWKTRIYNRNGILLYEGKDGWDGKYKGKPVANDTYFVVKYDSSPLGIIYKTDFVTVFNKRIY
jgi:large repetitive protein